MEQYHKKEDEKKRKNGDSAAITTRLERHESRGRDEAKRGKARQGERAREKRKNRTTWADGENEMEVFLVGRRVRFIISR